MATAGPSNIVRVGEAEARQSLQQSVRQACAAAGIAPAQVSHTCIGGSGAARPELAEIVRLCLAEVLATPIDVVGDMQIALEAAFDTGPGVVVIAGTGSIAYGRDRQGATARAGGWGFAIGDEGSAHWIGRAAVSAVLRASDLTGEVSETPASSSFAAALCKAWGVTSLADLARVANSVPPPDFAALFPVVAASQERPCPAGSVQRGQGTRRDCCCGGASSFPERRGRSCPCGHDGRCLSSCRAHSRRFLQ